MVTRGGWVETARTALLFVLPLALAALLGAQALDADYAVLREKKPAPRRRASPTPFPAPP